MMEAKAGPYRLTWEGSLIWLGRAGPVILGRYLCNT